MEQKRQKQVIGWVEHADLPKWHISGLEAKMDTGALTSSLDVDHIEFISLKKVRFNVIVGVKPKIKRIALTANVSRISKVKASPKHTEKRVFVKTVLNLAGTKKVIEVNLVDRSNMKYRFLIGRDALKKDFIVDPAKKFLHSDREEKVIFRRY